MKLLPTVLAAAVLPAALGLAACGSDGSSVSASSSGPGGVDQTTSVSAQATPTGPSLVGASAVPAVTGAQGAKPTIAKGSGAAPTTLVAHDVIVGTGATLTYGGSGTANYTLQLFDGTPVQSSYDGGQAFPFTVPGQLIPGFSQGVLGMKVGGRRELVIPPSLGYGSAAQQGIPGNSTLVFVVDLVSAG